MTQSYARHKPGWKVSEFAKNACPVGWEKVFKDAAPELHEISKHVNKSSRIFPLPHNIFRCFDYCRPEDVQVVILGQDPYSGLNSDKSEPLANGLAYSVNKGNPVPRTLKIIYQEIQRQYEDFEIPEHGELTDWAEQGVLLLNSSLTYNPSDKTESTFWYPFIVKVLKNLKTINPQLIFMVWGKQSQKVYDLCKFKESSTVLRSGHPNYNTTRESFIKNGHFKMCNDMLKGMGREEICWQM